MFFTGIVEILSVEGRVGRQPYYVIKARLKDKKGTITMLDFDNNNIKKGQKLFVSGEVRDKNILVIKAIKSIKESNKNFIGG